MISKVAWLETDLAERVKKRQDRSRRHVTTEAKHFKSGLLDPELFNTDPSLLFQ